MSPRPRLAVLVNLIPPYRVRLLEELARMFEVAVFTSGKEDNRAGWNALPDPGLVRVKRSRGFTAKRSIKTGSKVYDVRYLHITPGYLVDLVRYRPVAVLTAEMGIRTLLALAYGLVARVPVWVWWEGTLHTEARRSRMQRMVRRWVARSATGWISSGQSCTEYLLTLGMPRSRIVEAQLGVDERQFTDPSIKPLFDLRPRPVLMAVGQLIARKGLVLLLDAAARVQQSGRAFSLLIVGDGPERASLEAHASSIGLRNTHFVGNLAPRELPAVYRSGDCLVFPTLEDVWGLVVNEALWSGLPVIASRYAGSARELLPSENVFDPTDPADFSRVLERFLDDRLAPPDTGVLQTLDEVALIIGDTILAGLAPRRR